jgi:hypothetical protein
VHDASYDPTAPFSTLAAARRTPTGSRLIEAADEFKLALCAFLTDWQSEYDDGRSMQLPDRLPGIVQFWIESHEVAEKARDLDERRNLCHVLATEPLEEAA